MNRHYLSKEKREMSEERKGELRESEKRIEKILKI